MEEMTHEQRLANLLKEIKHICDLYKIRYFLIGSSLRGAVTCGGCLPGDSDIDIGMLRSDYLLFQKHLRELSDGFHAINCVIDPDFKETFTKIIDDAGAHADIQPFDNAARFYLARFFHWFFFKVSRRLAVGFSSVKINAFANLFLLLQKSVQEVFNNTKSDAVVSLNSRHGYKEFFMKSELDKLSELEFEGITCCAPGNPATYISRVYGYISLPFQLNKEQLNSLQKCHLNLLCEVKRICEKNGIRYFITDGTLLGAIKYKGAIPWDDDADIGMLKADYDRFMKACETDLGDEYCLNNYHTEPKYGNSFAEVCIRGTICRKSTDPEYSEDRNGIFIDIHPFINIPENKMQRWMFGRVCKFYKVLLMLKCGYNFRNVSRKSQVVVGLLAMFLSKGYLVGKIEKLAVKYKDTEMAAQVFGHRYTRNNIFVANTSKLIEVKYNSIKFPAQPDYDRILKAVYGENYMDPIEVEYIKNSLTHTNTTNTPLIDEQTDISIDILGGRHGIMQLDFGSYQTRNDD